MRTNLMNQPLTSRQYRGLEGLLANSARRQWAEKQSNLITGANPAKAQFEAFKAAFADRVNNGGMA